MPSIIFSPDNTDAYQLAISGDSLTIDPLLKPKPSAGVQVMFELQLRKDANKGRHLVGIAALWACETDDPTQGDIYDGFDNLQGLENLETIISKAITAEDFRDLKGMPMAPVTLLDLAELRLGRKKVSEFDEPLVQGALKAFLDSYIVRAEIECLDDGSLQISVYFESDFRKDHMFCYVVGRKVGEQLFEFSGDAHGYSAEGVERIRKGLKAASDRNLAKE